MREKEGGVWNEKKSEPNEMERWTGQEGERYYEIVWWGMVGLGRGHMGLKKFDHLFFFCLKGWCVTNLV